VSIVGRARARELYQVTIDEIARMATEMPDIVRRVGSLRIAMSDDELVNCDEQFAMMRRDDLPVERYEGPEGKGLLIPTDAVFNPLTRCRRLAESCLQRGAHLFEHSEVLELGTSIVRTAQGIVRCKHIIAAVDGKLDLLFPALSPRVRTARLQMLATAPTTEVHFERAAYARWGYEYWQQLPDGRVVLGGFRDHAVEQEWTHSVATTQSIQDKLTRFLRDYLHIHAPVEHRWAASVGYTVNGLPIIEEVQSNVWALGGYNGTGNVVGALCGRAVAEQVMATNASGKTSNLIALLRGNG
jgi:gamma-glutamylputrescine oxidase